MSKFHIASQITLAMKPLLRHINYRLLNLTFIMLAPLTAAETKTSTQISQANNLASKEYGVVLAVPDFLERNVNDDQVATDLTNYEKWDRDHVPSPAEKDLKEVTLSAKTGTDGGVLTLTVSGNVAAITCPVSGFTDTIYWSDTNKNNRYPQANHTTLTWTIPGSNPNFSVVLYIEGVETSAAPADIKFVAELTCPGKAPLPDTGETAVYETDADIDSTNDNEFAFTGFDKSEDEIEKSELLVSTTGPQKPGKFITNTSNSNYDDDQITDYADGFGLIGASGSNKMAVASDLKFIPLEIKLKKPYSASAKIKISYGTVSKPELSSEGLEKHGDGSKLHPYAYTVNKGGLRIWNAKPDERSDGQNEVDDKGNFVNSDTEYTWHQVCKTSSTASATDTLETAQLYVEYVEAYPALAHGKRDITVTITEGNVTTTDIISVTLMPVMLLADNNRDGYMRFEDYLDQTHFNQSYRFWINNDSDQNGGDTSQPAEDNPWAAVNPDCDLGQIGNTCQRNLEDFTRFHVYAPDKENWYSSGLVGMKLKWQQKFFGTAPEIRFYRAVETDGGRKYLSDETVCNDQTFAKDLTPTLGSSACSIPKELHASNGNVYLIYEGVKSGEGRITADLSYENKNIGESGALYSEVIDIRAMYEQKRVQASANFPGPDISTYTAPSGVTTIDDPLNSPIDRAWDEDTDNKSYTICLHGWDKTWYAARSDEQTIFKRMWQRGFKGRYIGFYWPTKTGKKTYNQSEYVAWNCGIALKALIDSLPADYKKNVIAHSMGNIVAGSALAHGAGIANYAILNSAVPAQCYYPGHSQESARWQWLDPSMFVSGAPKIPYYAWDHEELSDDPVYGACGYKGKIPPTSANLINYYLTNDEATTNVWEANHWANEIDPIPTLDPKIVDGYDYVFATTLEYDYSIWAVSGRPLGSYYEVMSMVNRSRTKSAGSSFINEKAFFPTSAIDRNVDLASFGFGAGGVDNNLLHEAVFTRRYCTSWTFYKSLMSELKYTPTP